MDEQGRGEGGTNLGNGLDGRGIVSKNNPFVNATLKHGAKNSSMLKFPIDNSSALTELPSPHSAETYLLKLLQKYDMDAWLPLKPDKIGSGDHFASKTAFEAAAKGNVCARKVP